MSKSTTKKTAPAAKKAAESQPPASATSATSGPEQPSGAPKAPTAQRGAISEPANAGDSGPGTGTTAPAEEGQRPPATLVDPETLKAPEDVRTQAQPEKGYDLSSTDHTYAAAGGRTIAGEQFDSLVDEDGKKVKAGDLFNDEDGKTFVTAKKKVYEQFLYPNTTEVCSRLLYMPGQKVNRAEAERIKATL